MSKWKCPDCGWDKTTRPRFETKPTPRAKTWLPRLKATAESMGTPLMPHQVKVGRLLTELRADGLPRWRTVIETMPRQNGKTVMGRSAVVSVAEAVADGELYGTAQSRQYAAKHVTALGRALGGRVKLLAGIGNETVRWPNGATYKPISPTEGGGHGDSIDFMMIDEGWALEMATLGGVAPAMLARPMSQMLILSTMGTVESTVWNGIVAEARENLNDPESRVALIEYSASEDDEVFDESTWHDYMPALGRTIRHEDVRSLMKLLLASEGGEAEVIRALGNRTVKRLVKLFPADVVEDAWRVIDPPKSFVVAVDVNEDPVGAAVATGHRAVDGMIATRQVEWRPGSPAWLPGFVAEMLDRRAVEAVVGDFGGPARHLRAELSDLCEGKGVAFVDRQPRDFAADHVAFMDALRERKVGMVKTAPLEEAVAAAARKDLGETGWVIHRRKMAVDPSPLVATILAFGLARELRESPRLAELLHF